MLVHLIKSLGMLTSRSLFRLTDGVLLKLQDGSVGDEVGNMKESNDPVEDDDSTKTNNKSQDESVVDVVGTTDDVGEDDLAKVDELQGESVVGNMNDLDGVKENESMKVDGAVLKDDVLM